MNTEKLGIESIYSKLLNISLSKKYNWFKKIELSDVKYGGVRGMKNFINLVGKIYVDSDWGHKQWREYHYHTPFPHDEELNFGEIIGGDLSKKLQEDIKICFSLVTGEEFPKYMSFSWLEVIFVDENTNKLRESIKKMLKEESKSVDCKCGWSWKLSDGGDDPYICHKCGRDNSKLNKVYYGFAKLPNYWVDDNDFSYNDEFFDDKDYDDHYFDNFKDMDKMFGHRKSLFGTRGLDVGDEKRTSRSFNQYNERYGSAIVRVVKDKKEKLNEVRVPRSERVELYKDDNIIVVVPLTHRALQKYATNCLWCINDDLIEWEDYHKGRHVVIIQRNPKKPKIGITGMPVASEIFLLDRWEQGYYDRESVEGTLNYRFKDENEMDEYFQSIGNDVSDFMTNIVFYSPTNGLFDMEDNNMWSYNMEISQIPNVTLEVIEKIDNYLVNSKDN